MAATLWAVLLAAAAAGAAASPPASVSVAAVGQYAVPPRLGGADPYEFARAVEYEVHLVNSDSSLLPFTHLNVTYGDPGRSPGRAIGLALAAADAGAVAVLGGVHSDSTVAMSLALSDRGVPLVSSSATAHQLSSTAAHPLFARTQMSAFAEAVLYLNLMQAVGWGRAVLVHSNSAYGRSAANAFTEAARGRGFSLFSVSLPEVLTDENEDTALAVLGEVAASSSRVVLAYALRDELTVLFRAAARLRMTGADYQWVLSPLARPGLLSLLPAGLPLGAVKGAAWRPGVDYAPFAAWAEGQAAFDNTTSPLSPALSIRRLHTVDAVRAMARALHEVIEAGGDAANGTLLHAALLRQDFDGTAGRVAFDARGDAAALDLNFETLTSVDPDTGLETFERFATVRGSTHEVEFNEERPPFWSGGASTPPRDTAVHVNLLSEGASAVVRVVVGFTVAAVVASAAAVVRLRAHPVMRSASPPLLLVLLLGLLVSAGGVLALSFGLETDGVCAARNACMGVSFMLVVGTLLAKSWRLNLIFRRPGGGGGGGGGGARVRLPSNRRLVLLVLAGAAAEAAVHVVRDSVDPVESSPHPVPGTDNEVAYKCDMPHAAAWQTAMGSYKGAMFVLTAVLAYRNRRVAERFNESRVVAHTLALWTLNTVVFFVSLSLTVVHPHAGALLLAFGLGAGSVWICAVAVGRKAWTALVSQQWNSSIAPSSPYRCASCAVSRSRAARSSATPYRKAKTAGAGGLAGAGAAASAAARGGSARVAPAPPAEQGAASALPGRVHSYRG